MKKWYLLSGAIGTEVAASLALKAALDYPVFYAVVISGYTASFALMAGTLKAGMGLGVAYGIWGALGVAATATLSAIIYDEALSGVMGLGIALVIAGVVTVELGSQRAASTESPECRGREQEVA
ncbi:SMR family transporter [Nocardioides sp. NPDC127503]|uniref:DMT family transporter n=1 Tax=Nocardioides sp. NPDC127503 TaxID=3154516 RepID=UPI00331F0C2A